MWLLLCAEQGFLKASSSQEVLLVPFAPLLASQPSHQGQTHTAASGKPALDEQTGTQLGLVAAASLPATSAGSQGGTGCPAWAGLPILRVCRRAEQANTGP